MICVHERGLITEAGAVLVDVVRDGWFGWGGPRWRMLHHRSGAEWSISAESLPRAMEIAWHRAGRRWHHPDPVFLAVAPNGLMQTIRLELTP